MARRQAPVLLKPKTKKKAHPSPHSDRRFVDFPWPICPKFEPGTPHGPLCAFSSVRPTADDPPQVEPPPPRDPPACPPVSLGFSVTYPRMWLLVKRYHKHPISRGSSSGKAVSIPYHAPVILLLQRVRRAANSEPHVFFRSRWK
jgi:hypothetical protein